MRQAVEVRRIVRQIRGYGKNFTDSLHMVTGSFLLLVSTIMESMDILLAVPIVLGWVGGLFINYAADVLPRTRRFSQPVCRSCAAPISWTDYLMLRACRSCGLSRSLRTWLVQLLAVVSFVFFWLNPPRALSLPLCLVVLLYFALITVIDIEHRLILFPTSVFGAILGLFVGTSIYARGFGYPLPSALGASLLGGVIGFALMFLFYQLGALLTRYRARRLQAAGHEDDGEETLGGGDVYLAGILGLMLGSRFIINGLVYGILLGGLIGLFLFLAFRLRSNSSEQALMTFIPYGPFLIAGAFIMLFMG